MPEININDDMTTMATVLKAKNITMSAFFEAADISPETWYRWKRDGKPSVAAWNRVYKAFRTLTEGTIDG